MDCSCAGVTTAVFQIEPDEAPVTGSSPVGSVVVAPPLPENWTVALTGSRLERPVMGWSALPARLFNAKEWPDLQAGYRCLPEQRGSGPGWLCWSCLT